MFPEEIELTNNAIENIKKVIVFLTKSKKHSNQTALIKKLDRLILKVQQRMENGENVLLFKGSTAEERTLVCIKIAIAYLKKGDWQRQTFFNSQSLSEAKAELINDCMMSFSPKNLPNDILEDNHSVFTDEERFNLAQAFPGLFKRAMSARVLLSAIFVGEEAVAEKIVCAYPNLLFTEDTYVMPLIEEDSKKPSYAYEQKYNKTTPLQLMLYTGDWKMWERIFPLIPQCTGVRCQIRAKWYPL